MFKYSREQIHSPSLHLLPYPRHWKRTQQHYGCCTKKQNIRVNVKVVKPGNSKDIFEYYFILTCTSNKTVIHSYTHIHIHSLESAPTNNDIHNKNHMVFVFFFCIHWENAALAHSLSLWMCYMRVFQYTIHMDICGYSITVLSSMPLNGFAETVTAEWCGTESLQQSLTGVLSICQKQDPCY